MSKQSKKILFAAGGTGGHLFPAQALAEKLREQDSSLELFFAAAKLSESPYFDRSKFSFYDIASTTPFRGGFIKSLKSIGILLKGICDSIALLKQQKPDLVLGFGSFHSFPVLCAAALIKIPIVLFESNAVPGKVVRLFSKRALFTGIFFPETKKHLKGECVEVEIPNKNQDRLQTLDPQQARLQFSLDPDRLTLLVFGGSQGAKGINRHILDLIPILCQSHQAFQLIHFTGNSEMTAQVSRLCHDLKVPCYIKDFEQRMDIAWSAADIAISRSGAMTLSELLHFEVPGILIPYPHAADQHQLKNAEFLQKHVGGAITLAEDSLSAALIAQTLLPLIATDRSQRDQMKTAIKHFKAQQKKTDLGSLILEIIQHP